MYLKKKGGGRSNCSFDSRNYWLFINLQIHVSLKNTFLTNRSLCVPVTCRNMIVDSLFSFKFYRFKTVKMVFMNSVTGSLYNAESNTAIYIYLFLNRWDIYISRNLNNIFTLLLNEIRRKQNPFFIFVN